MNAKAKTAKIRDLNDQLRKTGIGGRIMITAGIKSMGEMAVAEIIEIIRVFDDFTKDTLGKVVGIDSLPLHASISLPSLFDFMKRPFAFLSLVLPRRRLEGTLALGDRG